MIFAVFEVFGLVLECHG